MGKMMPYTTPDGVYHPESYWRPTRVEIDLAARIAVMRFSGYHDQAARDDERTAVSSHGYTLTGDDFEQGYAALIGGVVNPIALAYHVANTTTDTPEDDGEGNIVYVSFFVHAVDVPIEV